MDTKSEYLINQYHKLKDVSLKAEQAMCMRFHERVMNVVNNSSLEGEQLSNTLKRILEPIPNCFLKAMMFKDYKEKGWITDVEPLDYAR